MTTTSTTITVDSLPIANSIDPVQDRLLIYTASALDIQGISRNTLLGLSSQPVGINDSQTITTKIFDNSNSLSIKAANFTIQDGTDTSKQAQFIASGITTGTSRNYILPNYNATLATLAGVETQTNKTFTSPAINNPTITSPTTTALNNSSGLSTDTLAASGNATIGGTLGVTGNTTVGGTLGVTGVLTPTAGLSSHSVKSPALALSNALDSTNGVQTLSNAGTAGGTMSYLNLGGIKLLWCISTNQTSSTSGNIYTFTLPTSFFSSITAVQTNAINMTTDTRQYVAVAGTTTSTVTISITSAGAATGAISLFMIGI